MTCGYGGGLTWICQTLGGINSIVQLLIPIIMGLTVAVFFWGLFKYVLGGGESDKKQGRSIIIAGIIALFIEVCVWGIITVLAQSLNANLLSNTSLPAPSLPTSGSGGSSGCPFGYGTSVSGGCIPSPNGD